MTVTVNVQLIWLPAESVAVQVTVVTPFWKAVPDAGVQVTVGVVAEQLSVAVAVKVSTAVQRPGSVPVMMLAGQVIAGCWLSTTRTSKELVKVLAGVALSVIVHVTVVEPTGKVEPDAGVQTIVPAGEQLSVKAGGV